MKDKMSHPLKDMLKAQAELLKALAEKSRVGCSDVEAFKVEGFSLLTTKQKRIDVTT